MELLNQSTWAFLGLFDICYQIVSGKVVLIYILTSKCMQMDKVQEQK